MPGIRDKDKFNEAAVFHRLQEFRQEEPLSGNSKSIETRSIKTASLAILREFMKN